MSTARERIAKKTRKLGDLGIDFIEHARLNHKKLQPVNLKETQGAIADPSTSAKIKTGDEAGVKRRVADFSTPVLGRTTTGYNYVPPQALRPMDVARLSGVPQGSVALAPPTKIGFKMDPKALIF
jgi:hypothetical protein